jgi:hypothetical protein
MSIRESIWSLKQNEKLEFCREDKLLRIQYERTDSGVCGEVLVEESYMINGVTTDILASILEERLMYWRSLQVVENGQG